MKSLYLAALSLALASCAVLQPPTPQEKLAALVDKHPELAAPETVRVRVPVVVPQIEFRTQYVPVRNVVREQRDSLQLDSLLQRVEISLDSAQQAAARAKVQRWIQQRPVLTDTLCFDTLGVRGWVWRQDNAYQIWVVRKSIATEAPATIVTARLKPCPDIPHYLWYDPRGWAWWVLLLVGFGGGAGITFGLFSLTLRAAR